MIYGIDDVTLTCTILSSLTTSQYPRDSAMTVDNWRPEVFDVDPVVQFSDHAGPSAVGSSQPTKLCRDIQGFTVCWPGCHGISPFRKTHPWARARNPASRGAGVSRLGAPPSPPPREAPPLSESTTQRGWPAAAPCSHLGAGRGGTGSESPASSGRAPGEPQVSPAMCLPPTAGLDRRVRPARGAGAEQRTRTKAQYTPK
eukprot:scaffold1369_cov396-Prasinococcus_capsulatus_cf.AAC.7